MSSIAISNLFSVKGLVAVVTGGGTGIGLMIVRALAENGAAKVYIVGRRQEPLDAVAKNYSNVIPIQGDITSRDDLLATVARIKSDVGYINVLLANTGISGPNQFIKGTPTIKELQAFLWETPDAAFTKPFAVNVTATFFTAVAFLELLDEGNKRANVTQPSQVIVTSSIAAFNRKNTAGMAYAASKAAITHLMKMMGHALNPYGIRINLIAPGVYPSEMTAPFIGTGNISDLGAFKKEVIPATRAGRPEDMAGLVLFLTSKAGAYANGSLYTSDGGRLTTMPATM